jgi:mono/diheme cytochrome c family protein
MSGARGRVGRSPTIALLRAARVALVPTLSAVLFAGCGSARRGQPLAEERPPDARIALGQQVFDRSCSQCHPGGTAGLGPSLNNKPLPQWAMRFQVRHGVGAMPRFSKQDISDEQLVAVTNYLVWLRHRR